jgi:membrane-bound lytic murein transglycosylase D
MDRKFPALAFAVALVLAPRSLTAQAGSVSVSLPDPATLPAVAPPPDSASLGLQGNDARVRRFLEYFQGPGREHMTRMLARSTRYQPMIRQRFEAESLPADLAYLPLIESGYRPGAVSPSDAVGLWQFRRPTAREYGLRIDFWVDERRDPVRATDAAARHLRDLHKRFGSPYLAAAAYNAGAGAVARGLDRLAAGADDTVSGDPFFRLADDNLLAGETRDYVPALAAASMIANAPARYGFTPDRTAPLVYDSLVVTDATGLDVVARLAQARPEAIRELNLQYLRQATPPATRSVIRLPKGSGRRVRVAYDQLPPAERVHYLEHVVARGDRLANIAARYRVTAADIRAANPPGSVDRLRPGTRLVIPSAAIARAEAARVGGWRASAPPALRRVSALPDNYPLRPGMRLRIPG